MKIFSSVMCCSKNNDKISCKGKKYANLAPLQRDTVTFNMRKNVNFKGTSNEHGDTNFKELTPEEFESKKIDINKALHTDLTEVLNPYNIFVLEGIIKNSDLINNKNIINNFMYITEETDTAEKAIVKCSVIDKINKNPELMQNKGLADKIGTIINNTNTPDQKKVALKILNNPELFKNEYFKDSAGTIISCSSTPEQAKVALKILDNPQLCENEGILYDAKGIISNTDTAENAKVKCEIMDKLKENPELMKNKEFVFYSYNIISDTDTAENAKAKLDLIDKIKENPELIKTKEFVDIAGKIISNTRTSEESKARCDVIDKLKENPELIKNKKFTDILIDILSHSKTTYSSKVMTNFIDSFDDISKGIESAKQRYNLDLERPFFIKESDPVYDQQITLKSGDAEFRVDKNTLKLLSITTTDKNINIAKDFFIEHFEEPSLKDNTNIKSTKIIDNKTGIVKTQILTKSDISGEYNIYDVTPSGKKYNTSLAELDNSQGKHIEKSLKSIDGSQTDCVYADDEIGNKFLDYSIKDKNGNILTHTTRKFKVISDNHFISTKNKQSYDIEFSDDNVLITKLDKHNKKTDEIVKYNIRNINTYDARKFFQNGSDRTRFKQSLNEEGIPEYTADKKLLPLLKQIPGDEWFALQKSNTMAIVNYYPYQHNAGSVEGGGIFISQDIPEDFATFGHEAGHEKFKALNLVNDKELWNIYNKEKLEFTSNFPNKMVNYINYFLGTTESVERGLNECCAETNSLYNTHQSDEYYKDRTVILQQYFPKTAAYVMNKYNEFE